MDLNELKELLKDNLSIEITTKEESQYFESSAYVEIKATIYFGSEVISESTDYINLPAK